MPASSGALREAGRARCGPWEEREGADAERGVPSGGDERRGARSEGERESAWGLEAEGRLAHEQGKLQLEGLVASLCVSSLPTVTTLHPAPHTLPARAAECGGSTEEAAWTWGGRER
eukprot:3591377-Rhodomonas_salina.1